MFFSICFHAKSYGSDSDKYVKNLAIDAVVNGFDF